MATTLCGWGAGDPCSVPLPGLLGPVGGVQKKPHSYKGLRTQCCLLLEPDQELLGKRQEQGEGVRAQPGSLGSAEVGAGGGGKRSMQGQGHAWAQLNSRPSHVGESMALAERLVLLGVECLPFQVGLADLGRRAQVVRSRGADPGPRCPPQPRVQHWLLHRHQGAEAQSRLPRHQHRHK